MNNYFSCFVFKTIIIDNTVQYIPNNIFPGYLKFLEYIIIFYIILKRNFLAKY